MSNKEYRKTEHADPDIVIRHLDGIETWEIPAKSDTKYLSHSYFRYIGQFPPQIARAIIRQYSKAGETLIDPMCGGGTVLLEARLAGLNAIGIDINPVAILWSKVRCTYVEEKKLISTIKNHLDAVQQDLSSGLITIDRFVQDRSPRQTKNVLELPDLHGNEEFYEKNTLHQLAIILRQIQQIENKDCRDFALAALLAILRKVSLANKKKMNVVIDMKAKKYSVFRTYENQLKTMILMNEKMRGLFGNTCLALQKGDILSFSIPKGPIDMAIIHPPYPTNTSFAESLRLQLAFMGIDHKSLIKHEVQVRGSYFHKSNGVQRYLVDWHNILKKIYGVLRPQAICTVVVGDGRIEYVRLPMGAITCEFATDIGFSTERFIRHTLVNNTGRTLNRRMTQDYVIVLRKVS